MSTQLVRTIGKAEVTITVSGCVDCGSKNSPSWIEERRHAIRLGSRKEYITLQRCADCSAARGAPRVVEAPTALQKRQFQPLAA